MNKPVVVRLSSPIAVEIKSFIEAYKTEYKKCRVNGFDIFIIKNENFEIFAIHSMAGQVYSAAATMLLINEYKVDIVINYGVVGSLVKEVKTYDKCIVGKVVHYNFDTSEVDDCEIGRHFEYEDIYIPTSECLIKIALEINSDLKVVVCASGDKFITKKDEKQELAKNFKADICDMETAGIVMIANRANVPCIIIKTVSDSIVGGAKEFKDTFNECAILAFEIANKLINKLKEEV